MAAITLGRFAFGWSRLGCRRASRPATPVRSIRLGFLGPDPFRCEDPHNEGWIVLDFLGFSRPNRDFSMGYEA
jgi:hypothetical protein